MEIQMPKRRLSSILKKSPHRKSLIEIDQNEELAFAEDDTCRGLKRRVSFANTYEVKTIGRIADIAEVWPDSPLDKIDTSNLNVENLTIAKKQKTEVGKESLNALMSAPILQNEEINQSEVALLEGSETSLTGITASTSILYSTDKSACSTLANSSSYFYLDNQQTDEYIPSLKAKVLSSTLNDSSIDNIPFAVPDFLQNFQSENLVNSDLLNMPEENNIAASLKFSTDSLIPENPNKFGNDVSASPLILEVCVDVDETLCRKSSALANSVSKINSNIKSKANGQTTCFPSDNTVEITKCLPISTTTQPNKVDEFEKKELVGTLFSTTKPKFKDDVKNNFTYQQIGKMPHLKLINQSSNMNKENEVPTSDSIVDISVADPSYRNAQKDLSISNCDILKTKQSYIKNAPKVTNQPSLVTTDGYTIPAEMEETACFNVNKNKIKTLHDEQNMEETACFNHHKKQLTNMNKENEFPISDSIVGISVADPSFLNSQKGFSISNYDMIKTEQSYQPSLVTTNAYTIPAEMEETACLNINKNKIETLHDEQNMEETACFNHHKKQLKTINKENEVPTSDSISDSIVGISVADPSFLNVQKDLSISNCDMVETKQSYIKNIPKVTYQQSLVTTDAFTIPAEMEETACFNVNKNKIETLHDEQNMEETVCFNHHKKQLKTNSFKQNGSGETGYLNIQKSQVSVLSDQQDAMEKSVCFKSSKNQITTFPDQQNEMKETICFKHNKNTASNYLPVSSFKKNSGSNINVTNLPDVKDVMKETACLNNNENQVKTLPGQQKKTDEKTCFNHNKNADSNYASVSSFKGKSGSKVNMTNLTDVPDVFEENACPKNNKNQVKIFSDLQNDYNLKLYGDNVKISCMPKPQNFPIQTNESNKENQTEAYFNTSRENTDVAQSGMNKELCSKNDIHHHDVITKESDPLDVCNKVKIIKPHDTVHCLKDGVNETICNMSHKQFISSQVQSKVNPNLECETMRISIHPNSLNKASISHTSINQMFVKNNLLSSISKRSISNVKACATSLSQSSKNDSNAVVAVGLPPIDTLLNNAEDKSSKVGNSVPQNIKCFTTYGTYQKQMISQTEFLKDLNLRSYDFHEKAKFDDMNVTKYCDMKCTSTSLDLPEPSANSYTDSSSDQPITGVDVNLTNSSLTKSPKEKAIIISNFQARSETENLALSSLHSTMNTTNKNDVNYDSCSNIESLSRVTFPETAVSNELFNAQLIKKIDIFSPSSGEGLPSELHGENDISSNGTFSLADTLTTNTKGVLTCTDTLRDETSNSDICAFSSKLHSGSEAKAKKNNSKHSNELVIYSSLSRQQLNVEAKVSDVQKKENVTIPKSSISAELENKNNTNFKSHTVDAQKVEEIQKSILGESVTLYEKSLPDNTSYYLKQTADSSLSKLSDEELQKLSEASAEYFPSPKKRRKMLVESTESLSTAKDQDKVENISMSHFLGMYVNVKIGGTKEVSKKKRSLIFSVNATEKPKNIPEMIKAIYNQDYEMPVYSSFQQSIRQKLQSAEEKIALLEKEIEASNPYIMRKIRFGTDEESSALVEKVDKLARHCKNTAKTQWKAAKAKLKKSLQHSWDVMVENEAKPILEKFHSFGDADKMLKEATEKLDAIHSMYEEKLAKLRGNEPLATDEQIKTYRKNREEIEKLKKEFTRKMNLKEENEASHLHFKETMKRLWELSDRSQIEEKKKKEKKKETNFDVKNSGNRFLLWKPIVYHSSKKVFSFLNGTLLCSAQSCSSKNGWSFKLESNFQVEKIINIRLYKFLHQLILADYEIRKLQNNSVPVFDRYKEFQLLNVVSRKVASASQLLTNLNQLSRNLRHCSVNLQYPSILICFYSRQPNLCSFSVRFNFVDDETDSPTFIPASYDVVDESEAFGPFSKADIMRTLDQSTSKFPSLLKLCTALFQLMDSPI